MNEKKLLKDIVDSKKKYIEYLTTYVESDNASNKTPSDVYPYVMIKIT